MADFNRQCSAFPKRSNKQVVVGVVLDQEQRVLITRRAAHQSYPGLWEFPGGKVESGESLEAALCREMHEEVGLQIKAWHYLGEVPTHAEILLKIFLIQDWTGEARCLESQSGLAWVKRDDLSAYAFPKANQEIIEMLNVYAGRPLARAENVNNA